MIDREKLTYDLALRYSAIKCMSQVKKTEDPNEIFGGMLEDFALAYKTMSGYSNEMFMHFLHDDE